MTSLQVKDANNTTQTVNYFSPGTAGSPSADVLTIQGPGFSVARSTNLGSAGTIKSSAGQINGWFIFNNASSTRFIKFYDKATAPVVGTDTPLLTIAIPPLGSIRDQFTAGIAFSNGLGWAATRNASDSDTTAPLANEIIANVVYK